MYYSIKDQNSYTFYNTQLGVLMLYVATVQVE